MATPRLYSEAPLEALTETLDPSSLRTLLTLLSKVFPNEIPKDDIGGGQLRFLQGQQSVVDYLVVAERWLHATASGVEVESLVDPEQGDQLTFTF